LKGSISELKESIEDLDNQLSAKNVDAIAKMATVALYEYVDAIGTTNVLVVCMGVGAIKMKWMTGQASDSVIDLGCFFLPETYVKLGCDDIACVQIASSNANVLKSLKTQEVVLSDVKN
jgi:hypothetical protein